METNNTLLPKYIENILYGHNEVAKVFEIVEKKVKIKRDYLAYGQ